jgi:histidinol-phosphate aminotransferase
MPASVADLALPGVRALTPYQPGKPIAELEREYGVHNAIKLASNENPLGPSLAALAAIAGGLSDLARYPDGGGFALKHALAEKYGVTPAMLTLGNGSNDILEFAARVFVGVGDEVVCSRHAFAVYPLVTQAVGGRAVEVPAQEWGHDLAAMQRAVTSRTKLVFIANPNNPTGTWLKEDDLRAFLAALPGHVLVVLDEAYSEYVSEPGYPDGMAMLRDYPNLIVTRTFSKAYGLAGLRVGYGVSSPAIADLLNRVRQPFNVNSLALLAATAALTDSTHLALSCDTNRKGMQQLTDGFGALGLEHIPSVGNFVCVRVGDGAAVYDKLLYEGVIVRPVANYGMPEYLRVTVGLPGENERFLAALKKVLGR